MYDSLFFFSFFFILFAFRRRVRLPEIGAHPAVEVLRREGGSSDPRGLGGGVAVNHGELEGTTPLCHTEAV